jgi:hypothetical protein
VYANLDEILDGLPAYEGRGEVTSASAERFDEGTTFEASCYTDPLGIEHLTDRWPRRFAASPTARAPECASRPSSTRSTSS